MNPEQLKQQVRQIVVWKRGEQRAPHQPLLLLYALGRLVNDNERLIPYADVDRDLRSLLLEFGPERKACHTEYPFWRLQNDGIWELTNIEHVETRKGHTDGKKSELLKYGVSEDSRLRFLKSCNEIRGLSQNWRLKFYHSIFRQLSSAIFSTQSGSTFSSSRR